MKNVLYAFAVVAALAACDSPEQKAARYFAQAQELAEQGDTQRALVELRNALKNDPAMRDARLLFAQLLEKSGRTVDAYGQYREVMERNPGDAQASRAMTLIAINALVWDEAAKYLNTALAGNPNDAELQTVRVALDYRAAALANKPDDVAQAVRAASELLAADPSLIRARNIVLSDLLRLNDYQEVLTVADAGLVLTPDDRELNKIKLVALERLNRTADFEKQLLAIVAANPDDKASNQMLVQFYLRTGRVDAAEERMRAQVVPETSDPAARLALLGFLAQVRSTDAMRAEIDRILATDPLASDVAANMYRFRTLRAQAAFAAGDHDGAQADLEGMISNAEPSSDVDAIKIDLARMRESAGNLAGAKALIEEVIARDPGQTNALKIKANWLIAEDNTDQALTILRDALANAPSDPEILTLMAKSYQRSGQAELIPEMLSRAADVSNHAPAESINYANYLSRMKQYQSAEGVLRKARDANPSDFNVMSSLARVHLLMQDWGRLSQDIATLEAQFDTENSRSLQSELRAQLLKGQGNTEQLGQFLSELARASGDAIGPRVGMIQNTLAKGDVDQALDQARSLSADNPTLIGPQMLIAQILLSQGNKDAAILHLQGLAETHPDALEVWQLMQVTHLRAGDLSAALKTIDDGLTHLPDNADLLKSKAIILERSGDVNGAIGIYETLYAADTDDLLTANNLASLLASTRDDADSLERAWVISRRLNGSPLPAFQDTSGWIAFRRGDMNTAVDTLQSAAKGLPGDPTVAYHLGRAYAATGRIDEAKAEYERARGLIARGATAYPAFVSDLDTAQADLAR